VTSEYEINGFDVGWRSDGGRRTTVGRSGGPNRVQLFGLGNEAVVWFARIGSRRQTLELDVTRTHHASRRSDVEIIATAASI
jgi:hypothetical protein